MTSRHVEEIYDKDILRLQDFRSVAEADLERLRGEVEELRTAAGAGWDAGGSADALARNGREEASAYAVAAKRMGEMVCGIRKMYQLKTELYISFA